MSAIRPLQRSDLSEVARLYELVVRSGRDRSPPGLEAYFARTLLDHPWADPEIPSLVYTDADGAIVGFQGSNVRRARFDGRPIRVACAGQLVAHPHARKLGVGAQLVRAYLGGPQQLTITDGATEQMRQIWVLLGGQMSHLQCVGWTRLLRPWRFLAGVLRQRRRRPPSARHPIAAPLDAVTTRSPRFFSPPPSPRLLGEPLTPATLLEHQDLIGEEVRLRPAYDQPFLEWLFAELAAVRRRGRLVATLVREPRSGAALGWYVYYLSPGGISQVLQIFARDRDVGSVVDHLLRDAWAGGSAALQGRIEPRLLEPLARRRCLLRYTGMALVHSPEQEILGAISAGASLLTRLDGEWWMGHHVLDFSGHP